MYIPYSMLCLLTHFKTSSEACIPQTALSTIQQSNPEDVLGSIDY